ERALDVRLERWVDSKGDGWRSADVHVHLHYGGELLLTPEDASLAQRAEDVHFMNMMVANQGTGWVHDEPYFEGQASPLSTPDYMLRWGEEYRNNLYGHMCMYGIDELVPPIYSGFPLSEHYHDLPANAGAADHCHRAGGTLSYAHPMFDTIALDRVFADEHTYSVEAKELPVDAALGKIDAVDVMSYPGNELQTSELWYRLLNCGLRLAATAGTDTFMNTVDQGDFSNPPAGDRVYALIDGDFTVESWCEAVRAGRTFVTNGPMLSLEVNGNIPGDDVAATAGASIGVVVEAGSYVPIERLELIVNGEVVAAAMAEEAGQRAILAHEFKPAASCWVAARAIGPAHRLALDTHVFAHTSPVYVSVDDQPVRDAESAEYFVDWIERLIALAARRAKYPDEASRDRVAALFREGQSYYRAQLA
ncbi:MAG: CehA/McbA family metallohydrolase, partial [Dehalococcoidia bacterium]